MSEKVRILKAAGTVGICTLLSRVLGLVRDMIIALVFGAGLETDAFFVAFRIPNLFRRFVGEGSLTVAFVPVFTRFLEDHTREEGRRFVGSSFYFFSSILLLLTLLGVLLSPILVRIIAPGFAGEALPLTVGLTRSLFPYLFFIGLVALSMGILNSVCHFTAPALAPVWLNISIIASSLFLTPYLDEPVYALAIGVVAGGVVQLAFQFPFLRRYGLLPDLRAPFMDERVKEVAILMLPSIVGISVHQLNILVTTYFASMLPSGSVSYLYYADRLVEFPLGVFGIALSTAILPTISIQSARDDWDGFRDSISHGLRFTAFISIPSTVGFMILGPSIIGLLFERGEFTPQDTSATALALFYYSIGLFAFSGVKILASAFYALKDMKTPVRVAVLSLITNAISAPILMGPMGHAGLALATSIASVVNFTVLFYLLRRRIEGVDITGYLASTGKALASSLVMGGGIYLMALSGIPGDGVWDGLVVLFYVLFGVLLYLSSSYVLKSEELTLLKELLRKGL